MGAPVALWSAAMERSETIIQAVRRGLTVAAVSTAAAILLPLSGADLRQLTPFTAACAAELRPSLSPTWIHWLGWARDNRFVAWRQGEGRGQNRPGAALWLAEVGADGKLRRPRRMTGDTKKLLLEHDIHGRVWVWRDRVAAMDVLMRSRLGTLLAVVVRPNPPTLAVLHKWQDEYELVARRRVPGPVTTLEALAFESPDGSMVAVLAHTESGQARLSTMFILPLKGPPRPWGAAPLAEPASQTDATAVPASRPPTPTQRR